MASRTDNFVLAQRLALWLQAKGCTVTILYTGGTVYDVHYTLKLDMKPQPPARVNGSIVFPKGSQEDVVLAFLLGQ